MTLRNLLVVAITSVLLGCALELSGLSIELGYKLIGVLFTALALTVLFAGWRGTRMGHSASARFGIGFCVLLVALGWGMQWLNTSPRKHFYLLARETRPGESIETVEARFRGYRCWSSEAGYISFSTTPNLDINDVVVVSYDTNSRRVIRAEFSPD
jgi:hypothetical protein